MVLKKFKPNIKKYQKMKQYKLITLTLLFLGVFSLNAQQKIEKVSKAVKANKDVTLNLNTNYTNIEIDTWDKNEVQVEAYIESKKLSKKELQEILDTWDVDIEGSGSNVSIKTNGGFGSKHDFNFDFDFSELEILKDLNFNIEGMPEMPEMNFEMPEMPEMPEIPEMNFEMPEMPEMPKLPELPELPEGVNNVNFDVERYKKDGEAYLEKWSKEYEDKYGAEYKDKMKTWAKEFSKTDWDKYSKEMEAWGDKFGEQFGEDYGKEMEEWDEKFGKDYGKKMEAWGKKFEQKFDGKWAKEMEEWGEKFGKEWEVKMENEFGEDWEKEIEERSRLIEERYEKKAEEIEKRFEKYENGEVIKTIKIRMPKDAKLKVNVRHGELKFASVIYNLKADLAHSSLYAEHIDGSNTSINASYTPVLVTNWSDGELKLNYVDNAVIKNANHLVLTSNSSNIAIGELVGNAIIDGSFGELEINKISNSFNNLNIVLENSDAVISLPNADYSLQYKGNRTRFQHPNNTSKDNITTFSTGNISSNKTIVVNAKYSNVTMQ